MEPKVWNRAEAFPAGAVYVGRGSPWGNPFVIGRDGTRAEVISRFEREVLSRLNMAPLVGKHLLCFCAPLPCHGDVLLRAAQMKLSEREKLMESAIREAVEDRPQIGKPCGTCAYFGVVRTWAGFSHCENPVFSRGYQKADARPFDCDGHLDGLQGAMRRLERHLGRLAFAHRIENPDDPACGTVDDPQVDTDFVANRLKKAVREAAARGRRKQK